MKGQGRIYIPKIKDNKMNTNSGLVEERDTEWCGGKKEQVLQ